MDPLTQVGIGAALAVAVSNREQVRLAAIVGGLAGQDHTVSVRRVIARDNKKPGA